MSDDSVPVVWDVDKAAANERKHSVRFEEAATVFLDPFEGTIPDPDHSSTEDRWISVGVSDRGRLVSLVERDGRLRIISTRPATRRETRDYEQL